MSYLQGTAYEDDLTAAKTGEDEKSNTSEHSEEIPYPFLQTISGTRIVTFWLGSAWRIDAEQ